MMSVRSFALSPTHSVPTSSRELAFTHQAGIGSLAQWLAPAKTGRPEADVVACASNVLNEALDGGLPRRALTEILVMNDLSGELGLILPAVAQLGRAFWVLPNVEAFAPGLKAFEAAGIELTQQLFVTPSTQEEGFWAAERAVAEGTFGAVVAWLKPLSLEKDRKAMHRLALAARTSGTTVFIVRPLNLQGTSSAAQLRIGITPRADGLTELCVNRPGSIFSRTKRIVTALGMPEMRHAA